ncbi:MAG: hypothetical protein WA425_13295, partial [Xanthobacteraceae bacterium]
VADASAASDGAGLGGGIDVHQVAALGLTAGELSNLTAPSLFGGGCVVVIGSAQDATKDLSAELTRLAKSPPPDVFLVITHAGGAKNKALLADIVGADERCDRRFRHFRYRVRSNLWRAKSRKLKHSPQ